MNKQNSGASSGTTDVQRTDPDPNTPVVTPYPAADQVPVVPEIPRKGTTVAALSPKAETPVAKTPLGTNTGSLAALLDREASEHFRTRWNEIQGKFVDEPRTAVQQADVLVSEVIAQITQMFAHEHSALEGQWHQGQEVSSEDLRQALLRYRSFFNRLVI